MRKSMCTWVASWKKEFYDSEIQIKLAKLRVGAQQPSAWSINLRKQTLPIFPQHQPHASSLKFIEYYFYFPLGFTIPYITVYFEKYMKLPAILAYRFSSTRKQYI